MTIRNLTCAELEARLGDYLEGTLDDAAAADVELHLSGCDACAALVRDFESIVRQAAALPALAPSRDLWPAIEARLATRLDAPLSAAGAVAGQSPDASGQRASVIDLAAHAAARRQARPAMVWQHLRRGALAACLVGVTAVTTWWITSRQGQAPTIAATSDSAGDAGTGPGAPTAATSPANPESADAGGGSTDSGRIAGAPQVASSQRPSAGASLTPAGNAARPSAPMTVNQEIAALRGVLTQRRDELDPRTVAILETSLATIDSAITEARLALQADPASRFLSTQIDKALEKKLGLLRTAALLPART